MKITNYFRIVGALTSSFFLSVNAYSQNKVVVVPLIDEKVSVNDSVILGGGTIFSTGVIANNWGVPISVSTPEAGTYRLGINGLRPGCTGSIPVVLATLNGAPGFVYALGGSTFCNSGDTELFIYTRTVADTAVSLNVDFMVIDPDIELNSSVSTNRSNAQKLANSGTATPIKCAWSAKNSREICE